MKIWNSYGSEHSANLVMIGRFKSAADAMNAKEIIDEITGQIMEDDYTDAEGGRYSEATLELFRKLKIHSVAPSELEQFRSDVHVESKNDEVILRTDEIDVSAFLKVMIDLGARVEVFSGHDHPGSGYARGE
jgi:hypothetical protein